VPGVRIPDHPNFYGHRWHESRQRPSLWTAHYHALRGGSLACFCRTYHLGLSARWGPAEVLRSRKSQVQSADSSFMASDLDRITTVIAEHRFHCRDSFLSLHLPLIAWSVFFLYHRHRVSAQRSPHCHFGRDICCTSAVRRMASPKMTRDPH
jgi:hypothetical protein